MAPEFAAPGMKMNIFTMLHCRPWVKNVKATTSLYNYGCIIMQQRHAEFEVCPSRSPNLFPCPTIYLKGDLFIQWFLQLFHHHYKSCDFFLTKHKWFVIYRHNLWVFKLVISYILNVVMLILLFNTGSSWERCFGSVKFICRGIWKTAVKFMNSLVQKTVSHTGEMIASDAVIFYSGWL